jgi:hypothetical protein
MCRGNPRGALSRTSLTARELWVVGIGLLLLGWAALGMYVAHGGLYSDDWGMAADYRYAHVPRYLNAVAGQADQLGARPLLAVLLPIPAALFGTNPAPGHAVAIVLGVAESVCFFAFLRTLGLRRGDAGAIAALAFLFPWADSIRLWATGSLNSFAVSFALLGVVLSLRAIERPGWGAVRVCSVSLMAASVLTYEMAAGVLLLAGVLYFRRAPRVRAIRWWVGDVLVVGACLVYTALTIARSAPGASQGLHALPTFVRQTSAVLSLSFVPPGLGGTLSHALRGLALALAVGVVVVAVRRVRAGGDAELRTWLFVVLGGALAVCAGYALVLGTYLEPIDAGLGNRVNLVAGFGYVTVVYGLVACAVRVALRTDRSRIAAFAVLLLAIAVGYGVRLGNDAATWDRAASLQRRVLATTEHFAQRVGDVRTLVTFDAPGNAASEVPVFYATWDLTGALQLGLHDRSLMAFPVYTGVRMSCEENGVAFWYQNSGASHAPYQGMYFVDALNGSGMRITSRERCARAQRQFAPGPLDASHA